MEKNKYQITSSQNEEITAEDFVYVQEDKRIHDKKFQTKPTTFFKDAMKRFVKNRSSVVAAGILTVLIGMAIIVPIADTNSIDSPLAEAKYLPPKWFDNAGGFLDGTRFVERAVLDPDTETFPEGSTDYRIDAVVGEIEKKPSYADTFTPAVRKYGKGGSISLKNAGNLNAGIFTAEDVGLLIPERTYSLSDESVSFSITIDKENMAIADGTKLEYFIGFLHTAMEEVADEAGISLVETTKIFHLSDVETYSASSSETFEITNISAKLKEIEKFKEENSVDGKLGLFVKAPEDLASSNNMLLVKSISTSIPGYSWTDATKALGNIESDGLYENYNYAGLNIFHSAILYGSFRYDCYQHAFGDVPGHTFSQKDIESYVEKGWMVYEWTDTKGDMTEPGRFELTPEGEIYCPLRKVQGQNYVVNKLKPSLSRKELVGYRSLYRDLYAQGKIQKCEMPRYVFGTNANGYDFFKIVFSGLLVSLGLGVLASAINIVIGLVYGAVAGYFGGATDFIMERVTEILGGVPFIIVMTLITMFAQNGTGQSGTTFGTFLFALCLTGWLGVAGVTRAQFYRYKGREYVLASRTLGASNARLIFRHILPNSLGTIVTGSVLMIPGVIFTEANIAYLLPGALAIKETTFGVTLQSVQSDLAQYPYLIVSASIIMALIMISFNLFGNGLRDAFNPSLKGTEE